MDIVFRSWIEECGKYFYFFNGRYYMDLNFEKDLFIHSTSGRFDWKFAEIGFKIKGKDLQFTSNFEWKRDQGNTKVVFNLEDTIE